MRKLLFSCILSSIVLLPATAFAKPMSDTGYPVVSVEETLDFSCYAHTEDGKGLDLRGLCRLINSSSNTSTSGIGSRNTLLGGRTSTGNCDFSWQTDSAGRRCGGRAASERPGGSTGYTPSSSYSGGGGTYVQPYTRSDGTRVRGYYRR
jgi:hypothetical protein